MAASWGRRSWPGGDPHEGAATPIVAWFGWCSRPDRQARANLRDRSAAERGPRSERERCSVTDACPCGLRSRNHPSCWWRAPDDMPHSAVSRGDPPRRTHAGRDRRAARLARATEHAKTPKKAAASGWIGSALEYYDFFIYAQAAALVFPNIFFPTDDPQVGHRRVVRDVRCRLRGAADRRVRPRPLGRHARPQERAGAVHAADGRLDLPRRRCCRPTSRSASRADLLVVLRLVQGFAVGGEISGASAMILEHSPFGRRGYYGSFTLQGVQAGQVLAAAVFLPLSAAMSAGGVPVVGLADPVPAQRVVVIAGYIIRRRSTRRPRSRRRPSTARCPRADRPAVKESGGTCCG